MVEMRPCLQLRARMGLGTVRVRGQGEARVQNPSHGPRRDWSQVRVNIGQGKEVEGQRLK